MIITVYSVLLINYYYLISPLHTAWFRALNVQHNYLRMIVQQHNGVKVWLSLTYTVQYMKQASSVNGSLYHTVEEPKPPLFCVI